jgi:hypothetical protein
MGTDWQFQSFRQHSMPDTQIEDGKMYLASRFQRALEQKLEKKMNMTEDLNPRKQKREGMWSSGG